MTLEQIKNLIQQKIAGQGSAIDAASVMPEILNGICDIVEDISEEVGNSVLEVSWPNSGTHEGLSKSDLCTTLGITEQEFDDLLAGKYNMVHDTFGADIYYICGGRVFNDGSLVHLGFMYVASDGNIQCKAIGNDIKGGTGYFLTSFVVAAVS